MAEFSKIIPTDNGRAMIADVMAGSTMVFTKMVLSDTEYTVDELYTLTGIADIKQESEVTSVYATNSAAVRVSAAFTNEGLTEGYTIRSIGLYAKEEDGGEILYAAAIETTGEYEMPAQTGTTISSAYMQWVVAVGNSENVSVEISSNAYALAVDVDERFAEIELKMGDFVLMSDARSIISVDLSANNWSGSAAPYTQTVSVSGMTADKVFDVGIIYPDSCTRTQQKNINKAAGYISKVESADGRVVFSATERPETSITLGLKGVI